MSERLVPALKQSFGGTARTFWRLARQFFHEAMGAFFAVFALYGVMAAWRQWHRQSVRWVVAFAIVYAVMMFGFAFASFRRARRVR
jgi:TRAP-type C4-dicarboxylate transport system permease small subunit